MSKRVMILFGLGICLLVASLFLLKHEANQMTEPDEQPEEETETPAANVQKEATTGSETATE